MPSRARASSSGCWTSRVRRSAMVYSHSPKQAVESLTERLAPASLDRIVAICLAKDPDDRYQSARDLLRDLKWIGSGSSEPSPVHTAALPRQSNRVC